MRRYILSIFASIFITFVIFFLMTQLIKFKYTSPESIELKQIDIFQKKIIELEKEVELRNKPKLKSPATSPAPYKPKRKKRQSVLPRIITNKTSLSQPDFTRTVQNSISLPSPNISIAGTPSGYSGYGNGIGKGSGSGLGGTVCTMGFSLDEDGEVVDLQWYNCLGKEISDTSEQRLHQWIRDNPKELEQIKQAPGSEMLVTFDEF